ARVETRHPAFGPGSFLSSETICFRMRLAVLSALAEVFASGSAANEIWANRTVTLRTNFAVMMCVSSNLQSEFFELSQRFGIPACVVHRIVRVFSDAILFPLGRLGRVFDEAGINFCWPEPLRIYGLKQAQHRTPL